MKCSCQEASERADRNTVADMEEEEESLSGAKLSCIFLACARSHAKQVLRFLHKLRGGRTGGVNPPRQAAAVRALRKKPKEPRVPRKTYKSP